MGMTMTQKILAAHADLLEVKAGQLIEADLDMVLGNDITSPVAIKEMEKFNKDTIFNKRRYRQLKIKAVYHPLHDHIIAWYYPLFFLLALAALINPSNKG